MGGVRMGCKRAQTLGEHAGHYLSECSAVGITQLLGFFED